MPQAGERARHLLGLRLADARIDAHADVGDVGPRHSAQLPHDAGLRRAHLPLGQRTGRVDVREVPLEAGGRHAFARLGRGGEDLRRRSGLPPPRPVGSDRGRRVPGVGARPADVHRGAGGEVQLRRARRDQDRARGAGAGAARSARMVLNRNPDNFFAETEQVAFCTAHIVPGLDFTQRSAAGGPHPLVRRHADHAPGRPELPRDPDQRAGRAGRTTTSATACIARRSTAAAWPTSRTRWAAAARSRPARAGFTSFREPIEDDKVRGKPEKFADHYTQATLFSNSQTPVEQAHIIRGLPLRADARCRCRRSASAWCRDARQRRRRAGARRVADGLGIGRARRRCRRCSSARTKRRRSSASPALSLFARPGDGSIRTRRVAILVADGVDGAVGRRRCTRRCSRTAPCRASSARASARSRRADGETIEVEVTLETTPSVLYDALVLPGRRSRRSTALGTSATRSSSSRTSTATARPSWRSAPADELLEKASIPPELLEGRRIPASCWRPTLPARRGRSSPRSPGIGTGSAGRTRRACS